MPPIGEREGRGGNLIGMSANLPTFAHCTEGSRYPRSPMPPKFSSNLERLSGRIIKQACRRRMKRPSPAPPPWAELPFEITANILHRLGAVEILETAQYVCKAWGSVCNDPSMWRVIDMRGEYSSDESDSDTDDVDKMSENMCRYAVDKSKGMLVDISINYFASDELLNYIAERSENLRRLRLELCHKLSDDGLMEAIKRFPNLEEFRIILDPDYSLCISAETVETIGESCPLLRSFSFIKKPADYYTYVPMYGFDEAAYAIARSMPELRHLQLRGNDLTDEGLEAILDDCPHLESLDLKRCYNVKLLKEDLRKRYFPLLWSSMEL